jgi:LPS-assembly lipoprotein
MNVRAILLVLVLLPAMLLGGCGFALRGKAQLPPEMAHTRLVINDLYSRFARTTRVLLEQSGVSFVTAGEASATLEIPVNEVVTEILTIGDNARVREYRITHTVQFRLVGANGREIIPLQTILQSRDISFDEQQILAVSREQEFVRDDLAEVLARLLLSRLQVVGNQS